MGNISNALQKHRTENVIKIEPLYHRGPESKNLHSRKAGSLTGNAAGHKYDPKLVVITEPDSPDAEKFKLLRAQILFAKGRERPRTILVTSALPGEGKTLVAANLAASIALGIEEYVLLVDSDLRVPRLHQMFGYNNVSGLHEHLSNGTELQKLIINTDVDKLSMLTAGSLPANPAELVSSNIMESFIEEVKGRYEDRFIVIDSTPTQLTAEASVLARHVDGIILVVMAHKTPRKVIEKAIQDIGEDKILGIVFNGHSSTNGSYGSYFGKYHK